MADRSRHVRKLMSLITCIFTGRYIMRLMTTRPTTACHDPRSPLDQFALPRQLKGSAPVIIPLSDPILNSLQHETGSAQNRENHSKALWTIVLSSGSDYTPLNVLRSAGAYRNQDLDPLVHAGQADETFSRDTLMGDCAAAICSRATNRFHLSSLTGSEAQLADGEAVSDRKIRRSWIWIST